MKEFKAKNKIVKVSKNQGIKTYGALAPKKPQGILQTVISQKEVIIDSASYGIQLEEIIESSIFVRLAKVGYPEPINGVPDPNVSPAALKIYHFWAFASKMFDCGTLICTQAVGTGFSTGLPFQRFSGKMPIFNEVAKLMEVCAPYCSPTGQKITWQYLLNALQSCPNLTIGNFQSGNSKSASGLAMGVLASTPNGEYQVQTQFTGPESIDFSYVIKNCGVIEAYVRSLGGCVSYGDVPCEAFDATIVSIVNYGDVQDNGVFNTFPLYDAELATILLTSVETTSTIMPANVSEVPASKSDLFNFNDDYQTRLQLSFSYIMCDTTYAPGIRPKTLARSAYPNLHSFTPQLFELDVRRFASIIAIAWNTFYPVQTTPPGGDYTKGYMAFQCYCFSILYSRISKNQVFQAGPVNGAAGGTDQPSNQIPAFNKMWRSALCPPIIADYCSGIGPYVFRGQLHIPVLNMFPTALPPLQLNTYQNFSLTNYPIPTVLNQQTSVLFVGGISTSVPATDSIYTGQTFAPYISGGSASNLLTPFVFAPNLINFFVQTLVVTKPWIPIKMVTLGEESMSVVNVTQPTTQSQQLQNAGGWTVNAFFSQITLQSFLPVASIAVGRALVYCYKVDQTEFITDNGATPYQYLSDAKMFGIYTHITEYASSSDNDQALNKVIQTNKSFIKFKRDKDIGGHVVGINQNKVILVDIARREINEQIMQGVGEQLTLTTVKWTKQQLRMQNFDASFQGAFEFLKNIGNSITKGLGVIKEATKTIYGSGPGQMLMGIANQYTGGIAGAVAGSILS